MGEVKVPVTIENTRSAGRWITRVSRPRPYRRAPCFGEGIRACSITARFGMVPNLRSGRQVARGPAPCLQRPRRLWWRQQYRRWRVTGAVGRAGGRRCSRRWSSFYSPPVSFGPSVSCDPCDPAVFKKQILSRSMSPRLQNPSGRRWRRRYRGDRRLLQPSVDIKVNGGARTCCMPGGNQDRGLRSCRGSLASSRGSWHQQRCVGLRSPIR